MSPIRNAHPGTVIAVAVVVGYLLFLGGSAALAPPLEQPSDSVPGSSIANVSDDERATLVGLQGPFRDSKGHAVLVGGDGSILWSSPETWAHFDVSPLDEGRILSTFLRRDALDCGPYVPPCDRTGFRIFDPNRTKPIVREWTYPVRNHLNSEVHDAEVLPNGNVLVAGMDRERVFEVDSTGDIVWEWRASEYYDAPDDPTRTDWLHINDVDRIGPDRYLVSVRNENQLVILERGQGVVDVINEDGDPDVIYEQHNPQWLGDGNVLVADSGNDRVVQLQERNGTWEVAWEIHAVGDINLHWPRDVDLLPNGNLLITDSFNHRVVEFDRANDSVVWSISPGEIPYEADRLPGGEYPPGILDRPSNGNLLGNVSVWDSDRITIPGFTLLYGAISAFIALPYWISQWHLVGLVVTLIVAPVGLVWARVGGSHRN